MRNIFDQYTQPENQLTHALACTLETDRGLLIPFLQWAGTKRIPSKGSLSITEQQVPGEYVSGDETDGKGLPDAAIFDKDRWCLLIEAKVQSGINANQLDRHIATAKRHDFENPYLLLLTVDMPNVSLPPNTTHRTWRELYAWFGEHASSSKPAQTLVQYMQIFESRMIAREYAIRGTITMFDGLKFDQDNPYNYREGKRLLRLLRDELQQRKDLLRLGIDPEAEGRGAITGRGGDGVWDYIPLKVAKGAAFTSFPHLTLSVRRTEVGVAITIPNGIKGAYKSKLKELGEQGFVDLLLQIEKELRPVLSDSPGSSAVVYALQRHYPSQRSKGVADANLNADLRTILPGKQSGVKYQPEWVHAIYQVVSSKRSNIQMGIDVRFQYSCPRVRSSNADDLFAHAWIAMKPLLDFVIS